MLDCVLNTALLLQALFQPLVSLKYFFSLRVAFSNSDLKKYTSKIYLEKLREKNGNFTILNKSMLTSYRIAFRSVLQYYTV